MTPSPADRIQILSHKVKEAEKVVIRARRVWQAAQSRYLQLVEQHGVGETVTGAAWVDASATYEVYLDACKVRGDFVRAIVEIRRQFQEARRALRDRGLGPSEDA